MTGYQSKKAAALDEEGFYTIHPKDEDDDIQVYQRPWVEITDKEFEQLCQQVGFTQSDWLMLGDNVEKLCNLIADKLKEKNT